jgi:hypothetical protein
VGWIARQGDPANDPDPSNLFESGKSPRLCLREDDDDDDKIGRQDEGEGMIKLNLDEAAGRNS